MILHVNTRSDGLEPAGNHRAARLRRSAAAVPEARAPVRSDQSLYFRTDRVLRTSTGARPARPERRCQTADAVGYLTSEVCPVMARQPALPGRRGHAAGQGPSARTYSARSWATPT